MYTVFDIQLNMHSSRDLIILQYIFHVSFIPFEFSFISVILLLKECCNRLVQGRAIELDRGPL